MKNGYEIRGNVTIIFVKHKNETYETIIDTEDLEKVNISSNTWKIEQRKSLPYVTGKMNEDKKFTYFRLHRCVMDAPYGMVVDHINHNTLDNRKCNLRIVTNQENVRNRNFVSNNNDSGFTGVHWNSHSKKWQVVVTTDYKTKSFGYYKNLEDAKNISRIVRAKLVYKTELTEEDNKIFDDLTSRINRRKPSRVKSGVKGIHWSARDQVWIAKHRVKSKTVFEKQYKRKEDAIYALNEFKKSFN